MSPVKSMTVWLQHQEKHIPALEEVSPRLSDAGDLRPFLEDDFDDEFVAGTPRTSSEESYSSERSHRFDPIREITNYFPVFSPTPRKEQPVETISSRRGVEDGIAGESMPATLTSNEDSPRNQFDPIKDFVNFFSPTPKKEQAVSLVIVDAGQTPGKQQAHKRLNFNGTGERSVGATSAPAPREVATIQELYRDSIKALEHMMVSAKEVNIQESWGKVRQVDTKELVDKARSTTQRTAKKLESEVRKIVDSAKEVELKEVLDHAKASVKEAAEAVRSNARVHPRPWMVIGVLCFAILVQFLFFSGSVGTPAMRWWRFSVKVHSSRVKGSIVERVGNFIQGEMGEGEAEQIMAGARSTSTSAVSGQEVLSRLSETLGEPVGYKPDIIDKVQATIDMVRENPRQYYNLALSSSKGFVLGVWKQGSHLTKDAFDEITAL